MTATNLPAPQPAARHLHSLRDLQQRLSGVASQEGAHGLREAIVVIDGIDFQASLLALNAAVEAARAGDQGHGAAAAAGVGTLARHCTEAAREAREAIAGGTTRRAREALAALVVALRQVSELAGHIDPAACRP
jgi:methyl-accepting chemotaxis protein